MSLKIKVKSQDLTKFMKILSDHISNFSFGEFLSEFYQKFTSNYEYVDSLIYQNKFKIFLNEKKFPWII